MAARAPLDAASLHGPFGIPLPVYDRSGLRAGIAHFGVGNFHRAHQAVYLDRYLNDGGDLDWGIVGIGIGDGDGARRKADDFHRQDCLYTLTEFDDDGSPSIRVVGSMVDYLHAPSEPAQVLDLLSSPDLHIVTLTITEGGYFTDETTGRFAIDRPEVAAEFQRTDPGTVFGYLVRALDRRRDAGVRPFTVVSCDNLPHNGDVARQALTGFAEQFDPELAQWIDQQVAFPNSMVDRVVPSVSAHRREELNAASGVEDALAVMGESYLQWVLEDRFSDGRPELERAGVQFVDDVSGYETAKLRLLNAPHVLLSYPALLAGHRLVHEAIADPALRTLLETFLDQDVIPLLTDAPDELDLHAYSRTILDRFGNPAIGDQLLRIATDGASKIPAFHAFIAQQLADVGRDLSRELLLLACYRRYLSGIDERGVAFEVAEPTLPARERTELTGDDSPALLASRTFSGMGLADFPAAVGLLAEIDASLARDGVVDTIHRYIDRLDPAPR